ncbi:sirohydrochlorin chelatase [Nocardia goodfellowii]|uniref:Sirohydrochlorin ferrochelatase n=1 Tax=Nocardia goodfellowii TaxID=882446 RepID=A0ABS4QCQ1_9NOCA|nr:sirohydrochlorin chelatase [Nocardia goodfellowii]MBP2189481.1 sirohydrochlorin ferrochelatase [Nocardia goodfellowii]
MSAPALVLVAHGTRSARGVEMIAALAEAVAAELHVPARGSAELGSATTLSRDFGAAVSGRGAGAAHRCGDAEAVAPVRDCCTIVREPESPAVRTAFVDVLGPSPSEVLRDLHTGAEGVPAVVVPAFLASGYHVYQDVPREVAESAHPSTVVTPAMGPDPALARIMALRLRAAGWRPGDAVVFAAAGSSDARARHDVRRAAAMLTDHLATPVRIAYVATGSPRVPEVVADLRDSGAERVFIASYLLAQGLFQQRLHDAGADGVAEPIGVHPAVVRLIADRYRSAVRDLAHVHSPS